MEEDPTVEDAALVAPRVTRKGRDGAAGFTIVEGSGGGAVGGVVRFTALQLSAGRTYKFWVAAHSPLAGWGGWSTPHAFVAGQPTEIPAQPAPPTVLQRSAEWTARASSSSFRCRRLAARAATASECSTARCRAWISALPGTRGRRLSTRLLPDRA